jgi:hypothetical protein
MHKLLVLVTLAAAGCVRVFPDEGVPVRGEVAGRVCSGTRLAAFQGRPATSEVGAEILAASGAANLRWLPEGTIVTMEFSPSRVTVRLDAQNRIASATCG